MKTFNNSYNTPVWSINLMESGSQSQINIVIPISVHPIELF